MMLNKIEVITYHKPDGSIEPLRFRIEDENGELQAIKIHKVLDEKEEKYSESIMKYFICCAVVNGTLKEFKLKFDVLNTSWYLVK